MTLTQLLRKTRWYRAHFVERAGPAALPDAEAIADDAGDELNDSQLLVAVGGLARAWRGTWDLADLGGAEPPPLVAGETPEVS